MGGRGPMAFGAEVGWSKDVWARPGRAPFVPEALPATGTRWGLLPVTSSMCATAGTPWFTTRPFTNVCLLILAVVPRISTLRDGGARCLVTPGSRNERSSTNENAAGAGSTSGVKAMPAPAAGGSGAQPMKPPPSRQQTQAGPHSKPGTQTQPYSASRIQRP
jgi:hypothetical protein